MAAARNCRAGYAAPVMRAHPTDTRSRCRRASGLPHTRRSPARPASLVPRLGTALGLGVRIIVKRTLRTFWEKSRRYADARRAWEDWHAQSRKADQATPANVKVMYGDASRLGIPAESLRQATMRRARQRRGRGGAA